VLKLADTKGTGSCGRDIYSVNFADYLPETLKRDPKMKALAAAATEQMLGVSAEIGNVLIYSRIDELPEYLVDILAFDMHVDWYDYSYPLAVKRDILKNSVKVHKKLGTKYAVETALRNVYKGAGVSEWFEYGGRPYYFKINIDISGEKLPESAYLDILGKVKFYKNLRSHCDGIYIRMNGSSAVIRAAAGGSVGAVLKVKARTAEKIEAEETLHIMTAGAVGAVLKVKPVLPELIRARETADVSAAVAEANIMKVKAETAERLEGKTEMETAVYQKTGNSITVKGRI